MTMNETAVRTATRQDVPALKDLWATVFGDGRPDIDYFFDTYFSPALTAVIGEGNAIASAAYVLPVGELIVPGTAAAACAMIYSVATLPESRGRGYGEAVTRAAGDLAVRAGFPAVVLRPANEGLFGFYEKRSDFRLFFEVTEAELTASELPEPVHRLWALPVLPGEYRALRRLCLDGAVYIDMDERGIGYQRTLCAAAGGGLYKITDGERNAGCAIVEPDGAAVLIKELLLTGSGRFEDAAPALAVLFPARKYVIRTPYRTESRTNTKQLFGMMMASRALKESASLHSVKWYGPAFD